MEVCLGRPFQTCVRKGRWVFCVCVCEYDGSSWDVVLAAHHDHPPLLGCTPISQGPRRGGGRPHRPPPEAARMDGLIESNKNTAGARPRFREIFAKLLWQNHRKDLGKLVV